MNKNSNLPNVSIIIPCYNEEKTIGPLLEAISKQSYPLTNIEVVISDALSTDGTREKIAGFSSKAREFSIKVVKNHRQTIPAGVNIAAQHATGDIIVRLDAHSEPNVDYVAESVRILESKIADNVGGVWEIQPGEDSCIAKAIARATAHPLGVGDAKYRISEKAQYVDTVPFGAFYKNKFDDLGQIDESLLANEDYEFNARLRKYGGRIWLDPRIRSKYYARKNLSALAKQYWRYGFWKVHMLRLYPSTIRWRQAVPPLFLLSLLIFSLVSISSPIARIILVGELTVYTIALLSVGMSSALKKKDICNLLMPFAIITMHFSWASGFIYNLFNPFGIIRKNK